MDTDEIRDLLERFGAAWNDHDLDAALAMVLDEGVFESTGPSPDAERFEGHAAIAQAWKPIFDDPRSHFDTEDLMIGDDFAVQLWRYSWGEGHVRGVDVFRFRDGKVAAKLSYVKG